MGLWSATVLVVARSYAQMTMKHAQSVGQIYGRLADHRILSDH